MAIVGYVRTSSDGETLDAQAETLMAAGATRVFHELAPALASLEPGDTLLVTRLDRLGRSTRDLLNTLDKVTKRGAGFRSLAETWADTAAPEGDLVLKVLAGLAEFERGLIRARTGEGRQRAKARGQHMGRPPALTAEQRIEAAQALASNVATQADLARRYKVSQSTISRLAEKLTPLPVKAALDPQTAEAAQAFMRRLKGRYPVVEAILFGSRARAEHRPDSDADIAVVLEGTRGNRYAAARDMAGIAFDVMMETGVLVEALPLWKNEFERPDSFSNPRLIRTIQQEGLRL